MFLLSFDISLLLTDALMFQVAMKACPYRKDFYAKLGSPPEKVDEELDKWLAALHQIVTRLQTFYEKGGYNKGPY
jgi:hypothetical protein